MYVKWYFSNVRNEKKNRFNGNVSCTVAAILIKFVENLRFVSPIVIVKIMEMTLIVHLCCVSGTKEWQRTRGRGLDSWYRSPMLPRACDCWEKRPWNKQFQMNKIEGKKRDAHVTRKNYKKTKKTKRFWTFLSFIFFFSVFPVCNNMDTLQWFLFFLRFSFVLIWVFSFLR